MAWVDGCLAVGQSRNAYIAAVLAEGVGYGGDTGGGSLAGVSRGSAVPQPAKRARPQEMTKRDEEYADQKYDYDVEESP